MTTSNKERFLVFVDFLGTKERYKTPELVVRGRELFEQALNRCVVPMVNTYDMHVNVFSDTAIVTCEKLDPLLAALAELFGHFLGLQEDITDAHKVLWLRAGISHGKALSVNHLRASDRVRACHILDTSIPSAYKLEGIRSGSRVYVDPAIPDKVFAEFGKLFFKWQHITGGHQPEFIANIREYLWPAKHYQNDSLPRMTETLNRWWNSELSKRAWPKEAYHEEKMIHLDETLKLFIRTCSVFCSESERRAILFSLLPNSKEDHENLRFKWGVWFQALRGIAEHCEMTPPLSADFASAFGLVKTILENGDFFRTFVGELKYPDYAPFKTRLCEMGLYHGL